MKAALSGRASFVIAHRLSTIQEFDQILVFDGQMVQRGRHVGLLTSVGRYSDLHHNQYARHTNPPGRPAVRRAPQQEPVHWSGRSA